QMLLAINKAKKAAITPATVLLRGESGTGKELFAHAIHNESNRKYKNLVRVNCAAIPEHLLESELFGYDEGAFTGAKKGGKKGLFEQADEGTIFLDEISKMSLTTQSKFLRVLQEKEILRIGGSDTIKVNARVIAATNQDLEHQVKEGSFREDLYYRLNVIPIFIPPLRHRKNDIPLLVRHIIKKYNNEYGRFVKEISQEVINIISGMKWKGNVRELENFIGRIMINMESHDEIIEKQHLPMPDNTFKPLLDTTKFEAHTQQNMKLDDVIALAEKEYILKVLEENHHNKTKTAQALGISIRSLYYKLEKYDLLKD
ncbi:MAG: sigma 54-interacting transcriptional regulator, partial [Clostridia bacterium]|nr:sigma 54-interacting transcriptional regulator [Clostridia bacterium]